MGKLYEQIDADLQAFIEAQRMFFVATAPIDAELKYSEKYPPLRSSLSSRSETHHAG